MIWRLLRLTWLACAIAIGGTVAAGQAIPADVLAYEHGITGQYNIRLVDANRRLSLTLTRHDGEERFPTWSPDGCCLAFQTRWEENNWRESIYTVNIYDADAPQYITSTPYGALQPSWSPDGCCIAFSSYTSNTWMNNIFAVELETGHTWNLSPSFSLTQFLPSWSPDGAWLAVSGSTPEDNTSPNVYIFPVLNRPASPLKQVSAMPLTRLTTAPFTSQPAWVDATGEVLTKQLAGSQLFRYHPQGASGGAVPVMAQSAEYPSVAEGGRYIAFSALPTTGASAKRSLYISRMDGADLRRLTHPRPDAGTDSPDVGTDNAPVWRPRSP